MIRAIALDDEPPALSVIKKFCASSPAIELLRTFTKAEEAAAFLLENKVDLLFLDIHMPAISGLEFKKKVPAETMVIFTTAYSEYALEGFNLNAVDYLLKPFTLDRFLAAIDKAKVLFKARTQGEADKPDHIVVRVDYSLVKIQLDHIIFIEGLDDYLKFHLTGQKPLVVRMTFKAIAEKLPSSDFIRVHRSYIVALKKIDSVRNKLIAIGGEEIPLGASFEENFYKAFGR